VASAVARKPGWAEQPGGQNFGLFQPYRTAIADVRAAFLSLPTYTPSPWRGQANSDPEDTQWTPTTPPPAIPNQAWQHSADERDPT